MLEIMWVLLRTEKAFMGEVKTFQTKTTLHLPTLLQLYPGQVRSGKSYK